MAARLAMRTYDCRSRTPRFLASRVSPLIAACKSFASVGKVMSLGCTVVSTVTRAKSFVRSAPLSCATRKLSARRSSSLPPRRLRQWLRSERSCGNSCWKNSLVDYTFKGRPANYRIYQTDEDGSFGSFTFVDGVLIEFAAGSEIPLSQILNGG